MPTGHHASPLTDLHTVQSAAPHWIAALADPRWLAGSTLLKRDGLAWVRRATLTGPAGDSVDCIVKVAPVRGFAGWLRTAVLGPLGIAPTALARQWRGAQQLAGLGVATPTPLLQARARCEAAPVEVLLTEYLPGRSLLEHMAAPLGPARADHALADAAGELVAALIAGGLLNRDHKPSNILVLDDQRLALLDCVGLCKAVTRDVVAGPARMLASMVIEPLGCRCLPRRTLRRRALRAFLHARWHQGGPAPTDAATPTTPDPPDPPNRQWERASARAFWAAVAQLVDRHGDPTPAVWPLPANSTATGASGA